LAGGELLISLVGDVGRCAVVQSSMKGWNVARAIAVLRFSDPIDAQFVRACLLTPPLRHLMQVWSTTTVQATLNLKEIRQLPLPWPPKTERGAIAQMLGGLDDKIELTRRMNRTLESIARAVFKSWFVDFDPVRKKMEGIEVGLPSDLDAAIADSFEDSPLGPIPSGWRVAACQDEFSITMGQSPPGISYNEARDGVPFFQGCKDFGERYPHRRMYCTAPSRFAQRGDTLVSVRAPVGDINQATERCCVGRGLAAVRHRLGAQHYTFEAMSTLREAFLDFESGGTVFGSLSGRDFKALRVIAPPDKLILAYEAAVNPLLQCHELMDRESAALRRLRDALLPKLMSGEVGVQ
jgi:type I restriction enzyme S subunit